jgi:prevent-host-death family protein
VAHREKERASPANVWSLRAAKARFSELVRLAQDRPQRVTLRGRDAAVLLSVAEYERLRRRKRPDVSLLEFLQQTGFGQLDLERRTDLSRDRNDRDAAP